MECASFGLRSVMYKYERISRSNNLICVRSFFGKTENNDNFFKKILRKNRKKHNINAVKFLLICHKMESIFSKIRSFDVVELR